MGSLRDYRNRLLTRAGFRRWAQRLPIGRSIARKQSVELFRLCSGFIHSQLLLACIRLGLFDRLRDGPLGLDVLAGELDVPPRRLERLLTAAVALGLLEHRDGDRYGLGMLGAAVVDNMPVQAMVEHHELLYRDLQDPVGMLRAGPQDTALAGLWPYASGDRPGHLESADVASYSALMAASQSMIAEQVLAAYSLKRHRRLLDVGGGAGVFAAAVARRWPHLAVTLVDLPGVASLASRALAEQGLARRIEVIGADAADDTLPGGFDIVTMVRVLHDHDDARALALLRKARAALAPDGVLMVAEPMADAPGTGGLVGAYFDMYLLAMGSGQPRGLPAMEALLGRAGFARVRRRRTELPLITSVVTARLS